MLLSLHIGFNLVSAAVVCALLATISGLEPSSVLTCTWSFLLFEVSETADFDLWPLGVVAHQFGLLGTDLHALCCRGFVEALHQVDQFLFFSC